MNFEQREYLQKLWLSQFGEGVIEIEVDPLDHEAWLKQRKEGVGASDVPALFNEGYNTPKKVFFSKKEPVNTKIKDSWYNSEVPPWDDSPSEAAAWGHVLEDVIARRFAVVTDLEVFEPATMFKGASYLQVSVDRLLLNDNALLEIKNVSEYKYDEWFENGLPSVPNQYYLQVQAQLSAFPTMQYAYVAALVGGNKLLIRIVERSDEVIEMIKDNVDYFWNEFVEKDVVPTSVKDSDFIAMKKDRAMNTLALSDEMAALAYQYLDVEEQIKTLEKEKERLSNALKDYIGQYQQAENDNLIVSNKNVTPRASVDEKLLKKAEPDLFDEYQKKSFDAKRLRKELVDVYAKYETEKPSRRFKVEVKKKIVKQV